MSLDKCKLETTRLTICKGCPFYNDNNTCTFLIKTTGKVGSLYHNYGIRNPYARCPHPKRFWYSITSYHAWYLDKYIMKLSREDRHTYTKYGILKLNPLGIVTEIYKYYEDKQISTPLKRSVLLEEVKYLSQSLNAYQHVSQFNLKVNYVSGDLK